LISIKLDLRFWRCDSNLKDFTKCVQAKIKIFRLQTAGNSYDLVEETV